MSRIRLLIISLSLFLHQLADAQSVWTRLVDIPSSLGAPDIALSESQFYDLDEGRIRTHLSQAPAENTRAQGLEVFIPDPSVGMRRFIVWATPIVPEMLKMKFPLLGTWAGFDPENPAYSIQLDMTYKGFHAMVLHPCGSFYIDPYNRSTSRHYVVYDRRWVFKPQGVLPCGFNLDTKAETKTSERELYRQSGNATNIFRSNGITLRTYRAAIACTGEYASFHGGTTSGALSAIVTSLNRVSGVYEKELSIRMTLVPNNDTVIFLNASTDPYSNNNGGTMLGQNQTVMTTYIGTSNYDIGHVFSTGGGGIAGLGVVCSATQKARGVTGSGSPVGDPFDIDYVAHEIGHQFGANHTFNGNAGGCSGNINPSTAYEPGSGTTIMAYAGLCSPQNTQNFSDPYFHTVSFDEILDYVTLSTGGICPVSTPTGNTPPQITSTGGDHIIPCSTPFILEGEAFDADGDSLVFCWEQFDIGPAGSPTTPSGNAPLFRSFKPVPTPARVFPKLPALVSNAVSVGERLPTYDRSMTFRLTARDNRFNGGGVTYEDVVVTLTAVNTGSPFLVTSPNTAVTWIQGSQEVVTWNVSGTDLAPINAQFVDIFLSTDGGYTYPQLLASSAPNTGQATVNVPVVSTTQARVMVRGAGNVFFDISNVNFTISAPQGDTDPLTLETIRIYPNPAGASTMLSMAGPFTGDLRLTLVDISGRILRSETLVKTGSGMTYSLDLSEMMKGLYLIRLQTSGGIVTYRLVVGADNEID